MDYGLKDKVAIVTGGTSGIGLAISERLLKEGAQVVVASRNNDKNTLSEKINFVKTDVREENDVIKLIEYVVSKFGKIDIVVNSAGVSFENENDVTTFPTEKMQDTMQINFMGTVFLTKCSIPHLLRTTGKIVNISSICGLRVLKDDAFIYSASKAAVISFTKSMALNYASKGLQINAVCPGGTDTPMLRNLFGSEEDYKKYAQSMPSGKIGKPEYVANLVAFLVSNEAKHITGGVFTIDGGESLK